MSAGAWGGVVDRGLGLAGSKVEVEPMGVGRGSDCAGGNNSCFTGRRLGGDVEGDDEFVDVGESAVGEAARAGAGLGVVRVVVAGVGGRLLAQRGRHVSAGGSGQPRRCRRRPKAVRLLSCPWWCCGVWGRLGPTVKRGGSSMCRVGCEVGGAGCSWSGW